MNNFAPERHYDIVGQCRNQIEVLWRNARANPDYFDPLVIVEYSESTEKVEGYPRERLVAMMAAAPENRAAFLSPPELAMTVVVLDGDLSVWNLPAPADEGPSDGRISLL